MFSYVLPRIISLLLIFLITAAKAFPSSHMSMDSAIEAARAGYSETSFKGDYFFSRFPNKHWGCQFPYYGSLQMYVTTTIIVL